MNVFGERQHPEKFIPKVIRGLLTNKEITIHADKKKKISGSRFYIHAKDVAEAVLFLLHKGNKGEKYNLVGAKEIHNLELAKKIAKILKKDLKYKLVDYHKKHGKLSTVTSVRPPARFGSLKIKGEKVIAFKEKSQSESGWINGGFFVFEPKIFDFIKDDNTYLEREPLEKLANIGELNAFKHENFWQCMDTKRDKDYLEELLKNNKAPWLK